MPCFQSSSQINDLIKNLPSVDAQTQNKATSRQAELTKPPGSLGKLEDIAIWMAGWQRRDRPAIEHGQRTWKSENDRIGQRIRVLTKTNSDRSKYLRLSPNLDVHL